MRAHTDPELFARWVGPDGMQTRILDWDATTGGRWRYVAGRDALDGAGELARDAPVLVGGAAHRSPATSASSLADPCSMPVSMPLASH